MADFVDNDIYDNGLAPLATLVENCYICSQQPTTFTEASVTYKLGTKASPTISAPQAGDVSGRKVVQSAITDGVVDAPGDASHMAWCDNSDSKLLMACDLSAPVTVATGIPWTLTEIDFTIPAPTT